MKRKFIAAVTVLAMVMTTIVCLPMGASAYSYGKDVLTHNFEDKTEAIGTLVSGGVYSNNGTGIPKFVANDPTKLPDGGNVAVQYYQNSADGVACKTGQVLIHFGQNEQISFGDSRVTLDLYRGEMTCPFQVGQKIYKKNGTGTVAADWGEGNPLQFEKNGTLSCFGTNVGKYEKGLYKIQVDYLGSQNKVVATLVSGKLDGQEVSNKVLGEKKYTKELAAIFQIYLTQNPSTALTEGVMEDWIDNVKREALPNVWTSNQISENNGVKSVAPGIETISFITPRYLENADYANWFTIKKDGAPMDASTYTVTGQSVGATATSNVGYNPSITFTGGLQPGAYEISANVKDTYGKDIPAIAFTVASAESDCDIKSVTQESGLELTTDSIKNLTKGTKTADLKSSITIPAGATVKVGKAEQEPTILFGGETLTVTSGDGKKSKEYAIVAKADAFSYDFNNAVLRSELASTDVPNATNRGSNPANKLGVAFPNAGFSQYYATPASKIVSGEVYIAGESFPLKSDRAGKVGTTDLVSNAADTVTLRRQNLCTTAPAKPYVLNVSVKPAKGAKTTLYLYSGNHNSSNAIGMIDFNVPNKKIEITGPDGTGVVQVGEATNNWYTASFYCEYDSAASKTTVKAYINGEYVGTTEKAVLTDTSNHSINKGLSFGLSAYIPQKTSAYNGAACIDNISVYECEPIEGNVLPNNTDFALTENNDLVDFDNLSAKVSAPWITVKELCDSFTMPEGVSVEVQTKDETAVVAETEMIASGMKLVFKKGELWKTYTISTASLAYSEEATETGKTMKAELTIPKGLPAGTYILAVYRDGIAEAIQLAEKEAGVAASAAVELGMPSQLTSIDYEFRAFMLEDTVSLRPILNSITLTAE